MEKHLVRIDSFFIALKSNFQVLLGRFLSDFGTNESRCVYGTTVRRDRLIGGKRNTTCFLIAPILTLERLPTHSGDVGERPICWVTLSFA